jgi:hypothetical protein
VKEKYPKYMPWNGMTPRCAKFSLLPESERYLNDLTVHLRRESSLATAGRERSQTGDNASFGKE